MKIETVTLQPIPNFSREIGLFLASLEDIRAAWQDAVQDLSKAELATKILPEVQPIGTIIIHIAEAEFFWVQEVVGGKPMTDETKRLLHHDLWLKDFAAEDLDVDYYLQVVEKIHNLTKETLIEFTDDDLEKFFIRKKEDRETHLTLRFIFKHLLDHEGTHKGQILMIRRLVKSPTSDV